MGRTGAARVAFPRRHRAVPPSRRRRADRCHPAGRFHRYADGHGPAPAAACRGGRSGPRRPHRPARTGHRRGLRTAQDADPRRHGQHRLRAFPRRGVVRQRHPGHRQDADGHETAAPQRRAAHAGGRRDRRRLRLVHAVGRQRDGGHRRVRGCRADLARLSGRRRRLRPHHRQAAGPGRHAHRGPIRRCGAHRLRRRHPDLPGLGRDAGPRSGGDLRCLPLRHPDQHRGQGGSRQTGSAAHRRPCGLRADLLRHGRIADGSHRADPPAGPAHRARGARAGHHRQVRRRVRRRPDQRLEQMGGARARRGTERAGCHRDRGRHGGAAAGHSQRRDLHDHHPRRDRHFADDAADPAVRDEAGGTDRRGGGAGDRAPGLGRGTGEERAGTFALAPRCSRA
uniref:Putative antiporter n=1 Tax=Amycolatopsis orientalis TaxID=31958 RepID=F8STZ1_AMYOR|nr:putative antiporter [Amycolatopsis orientalis HCCB10007]